jgi:hypothetical protein
MLSLAAQNVQHAFNCLIAMMERVQRMTMC